MVQGKSFCSKARFNHIAQLNPLRANPTKWPNTLKQFVVKLPTNCLSVFGHFDNLALKSLIIIISTFLEDNGNSWKIMGKYCFLLALICQREYSTSCPKTFFIISFLVKSSIYGKRCVC